MKALVCGEALIDLIKQPDSSWIAHNGGGPLNTAKALVRLGEAVDFLGRIAADPFGLQLRTDIQNSGIGMAKIVDATEPTSLAVVEISDQGSASYSFYLENTSNFCWQDSELPSSGLAGYDLLHIGTLALIIQPGSQVLFNWVAEHSNSSVVMMDLNIRPSVIADAKQYLNLISPWLSFADILKVSDEDLAFLYPTSNWSEIAKMYFANTKVKLIAITLGSAGAVLLTPDHEVRLAAPKVDVVDSVGAGDTFSAALASKLNSFGKLNKSELEKFTQQELFESLEFAIFAAALNCTRSGADAPTKSEVLEAISVG